MTPFELARILGTSVIVVVDFDRRALREAATECPTYADGRATHAVILDSSGEVVDER